MTEIGLSPSMVAELVATAVIDDGDHDLNNQSREG